MNDTSISDRARKASWIYLGVGGALIAVPVLILASAYTGVDESGLMTTMMFIMAGIPCAMAGIVMLIIGMVQARRARRMAAQNK